MLQLSYIREHKEQVIELMKKRNLSSDDLKVIDEAIDLDDQRKQAQTEMDSLLYQNKQLAGEIGNLYKSGKRDEAEVLKAKVASIKEDSKALQEQKENAEARIEELMLGLPNIPHESVPAGTTEEDNEVFKAFEGTLPTLSDQAVPHCDLVEKYNLIDFEAGVKIAGSGFPLFRGKGSRLQRALINFFLDEEQRRAIRNCSSIVG